MYLKVKYFQVNEEGDLHIANGTLNPRKLPKRGQNTKIVITALVTQ
jgi:hypothetical protein